MSIAYPHYCAFLWSFRKYWRVVNWWRRLTCWRWHLDWWIMILIWRSFDRPWKNDFYIALYVYMFFRRVKSLDSFSLLINFPPRYVGTAETPSSALQVTFFFGLLLFIVSFRIGASYSVRARPIQNTQHVIAPSSPPHLSLSVLRKCIFISLETSPIYSDRFIPYLMLFQFWQLRRSSVNLGSVQGWAPG